MLTKNTPFLLTSTKQSVASLFCTPGYRHSPPHFHLCGSHSVCNQRELPTRGGDAGCRCSWAHCAKDELSTHQDIMRGLTPPITPALLARTLCKYPEQTLQWLFMTVINKCSLKVSFPYKGWTVLVTDAAIWHCVNMDITENSDCVIFSALSVNMYPVLCLCSSHDAVQWVIRFHLSLKV